MKEILFDRERLTKIASSVLLLALRFILFHYYTVTVYFLERNIHHLYFYKYTIKIRKIKQKKAYSSE